MPKTASVYTRVEPELKEQVEKVLLKLGLPMANAINLFLHQIVIHNGLPFDIKLPTSKPLNYATMTKEQFDTEMEKGLADYYAGRTMPSLQVREEMQREIRRDVGD